MSELVTVRREDLESLIDSSIWSFPGETTDKVIAELTAAVGADVLPPLTRDRAAEVIWHWLQSNGLVVSDTVASMLGLNLADALRAAATEEGA